MNRRKMERKQKGKESFINSPFSVIHWFPLNTYHFNSLKFKLNIWSRLIQSHSQVLLIWDKRRSQLNYNPGSAPTVLWDLQLPLSSPILLYLPRGVTHILHCAFLHGPAPTPVYTESGNICQ